MPRHLAALTALAGFAALGAYDCYTGDLHCAGHALCGLLTALVSYAKKHDSRRGKKGRNSSR